MIPKKERASSFLINEIFKSGRRLRSTYFDVVFSKANIPHPIFAVSVMKNSYKNSVSMHRTRRLFYDSIKKSGIKNSGIYVFIVKKQIQSKDQNTLIDEIKKTFPGDCN